MVAKSQVKEEGHSEISAGQDFDRDHMCKSTYSIYLCELVQGCSLMVFTASLPYSKCNACTLHSLCISTYQ